jgi:hypothetical protein
VWAAAAIAAGTPVGADGDRRAPARAARARLGALAAGREIGTVALGAGLTADGATVDGSVGPVLCGAVGDVVRVPAVGRGEERWFLVAGADADVAPLDALDPTRALVRLTFRGAAAIALPGLTRPVVEQLGLALAATECAGGAAWCVDTAATYAAHRRQFGRPIGQFQAVKHRCADMLVHLQQVHAVAWDAVVALDGDDPHGPEALLAAAAAGAVAFEGFAAVAKDCIQVLGGIGFTWEHDAHLYLKRAKSSSLLLGDPRHHRRLLGDALGF